MYTTEVYRSYCKVLQPCSDCSHDCSSLRIFVECDSFASLSIEMSKENLNIFDFELGSGGLGCVGYKMLQSLQSGRRYLYLLTEVKRWTC